MKCELMQAAGELSNH